MNRLADKPFALVGVNADKNRQTMLKLNDERHVNWRTFWIGEDGPKGAIAMDWNVYAWPSLYVIDHKGVIRHKWRGSPAEEIVDEAIDALVSEAVAAKGQ